MEDNRRMVDGKRIWDTDTGFVMTKNAGGFSDTCLLLFSNTLKVVMDRGNSVAFFRQSLTAVICTQAMRAYHQSWRTRS